MSKILVIIATINPLRVATQIENFIKTCSNSENIEFGIKVDHGDWATINSISGVVSRTDAKVTVFLSPRGDGYYTLHHWYQEIYANLRSDTHVLIFPVNDEVRFITMNWDIKLLENSSHFSDGFFKLKISRNRYRNFYSLREVLTTPENYPIFSPKMLDAQGGIVDCWVPDGWSSLYDF